MVDYLISITIGDSFTKKCIIFYFIIGLFLPLLVNHRINRKSRKEIDRESKDGSVKKFQISRNWTKTILNALILPIVLFLYILFVYSLFVYFGDYYGHRENFSYSISSLGGFFDFFLALLITIIFIVVGLLVVLFVINNIFSIKKGMDYLPRNISVDRLNQALLDENFVKVDDFENLWISDNFIFINWQFILKDMMVYLKVNFYHSGENELTREVSLYLFLVNGRYLKLYPNGSKYPDVIYAKDLLDLPLIFHEESKEIFTSRELAKGYREFLDYEGLENIGKYRDDLWDKNVLPNYSKEEIEERLVDFIGNSNKN